MVAGERGGCRCVEVDPLRPDGGQSSFDRALVALANRRRRRVLYRLTEDDPVDVEELADDVAAREDAGATPGDDASQRVLVSLAHHHLPKLNDVGLVEYDRDSGVVRHRKPPEYVAELLRLTREYDEE